MEQLRRLLSVRFLLGLSWLAFQFYIVRWPQEPMIQRPLHVGLALALLFLWRPLRRDGPWRRLRLAVDWGLAASALVVAAFFLWERDRFIGRMELVDPVFLRDMVLGVLLVVALLEATRRTAGWSLLGTCLFFLAYAALGPRIGLALRIAIPVGLLYAAWRWRGGRGVLRAGLLGLAAIAATPWWIPGWLEFKGFGFAEGIEILFLGDSGIYGIPVEASLQFVFYFVTFGAIYAATGGGQLFIDIGLRIAGRSRGGAAKAAVVSSGLMGTISGSAVANVTATGVFTIPLMKRSGYSPEMAGATEAIASTGGQLMPPIMGIGAFVMAELLQIDYSRIALAGLLPALGFYASLFLIHDLRARRSGVGVLSPAQVGRHAPILPRLHLLVPPLVLVYMIVQGYSATYAAVVASGSALAVSCLRKSTRLDLKGLLDVVDSTARQASSVVIPIAAIGIIIAVAIQSNLAIKFSTRLMELSGGTLTGALFFIIVGLVILGMGLPTVAAYIIGAILFVPALKLLGFQELASHFFVFYYSVLAMVTPPVALASFTAAGLAQADTTRTGLYAFRQSLVAFLVPFAFLYDPALLFFGGWNEVVLSAVTLLWGVTAWVVGLVGYLNGRVTLVERGVLMAAAFGVIVSPPGTMYWILGLVLSVPAFAGRLLLGWRREAPA